MRTKKIGKIWNERMFTNIGSMFRCFYLSSIFHYDIGDAQGKIGDGDGEADVQ